MTVHLSRPAVGITDLDHLKEVMKARAPRPAITTRNTPKRADDLTDGGSVYWIIGGQYRARQKVVKVETMEDDEGRNYCRITLDATVVPTMPYPRRAHQGWRYLDPAAAPPDLIEGDTADMPPELVAELKELGLI